MRVSIVFSKYIMRKFSFWFLSVLSIFSVIIFLLNTLELSRRSYNKAHMGFAQISLLSFYQLPEILMQLMPFIILFATMILLWQMNRRLELIVARALGFSIWTILWPVWIAILGFSIANFALFNPISAEFSSRFEQMESDLLKGGTGLLVVSSSGIWLKQEDKETYSLVRVARVDKNKTDLHDVSLYTFDRENRFVNRLDSPLVKMDSPGWLLQDARLSAPNQVSERMGNLLWKTDLTVHKIQESFIAPDSVPLWKLPAFIDLMNAAGLSSIEHLHHFYKNLMLPFLLIVMAAIAGLCAYHFTRRKGGAPFVLTGLGAGFLVFFLQKISHAMGLAGTIPLFLSVLMPIFIGALGSIALLIHLEER
jgi:lipopolysaccharide export system permease protein